MMRRTIRRCVLLALLAVFAAAPAAAGTIVGQVYFQRDIICDIDVCDPPVQFEYFGSLNVAELPGFTFSTLIQVQNGPDVDTYEFFDSGISEALWSQPFFDLLSFAFTADDVSLYPGALTLGKLEYVGPPPLDGFAPMFQVEVVYNEASVTVPEAPSMLVVLIGLSALAVGRAFFV
jgi:hypothetical protein